MANYFLGNAFNVACENYYDLFGAPSLCAMDQCAYTFPAGSTVFNATPIDASYDYLGSSFTIINGTAAPESCVAWSYAPNVSSANAVRAFSMFVNYGTTINITFEATLSKVPECYSIGTLNIRGINSSNLGTLIGSWYANNSPYGGCSNYTSITTPEAYGSGYYAELNTKAVIASTALSNYCCPSGWAGPFAGPPPVCSTGGLIQDAWLNFYTASMVSSYEYTCDNPCGVSLYFNFSGYSWVPGTVSFPGGAGGSLSFYATILGKTCPTVA